MIQSTQCVCAVKNLKQLSTTLRCDFYSIYRLEILNDTCALNRSLRILYGEEEFSFKINSKIFKCTIKFIKKHRFSGPLFLY